MGVLKVKEYELDCSCMMQELEHASVASEHKKCANLCHPPLGHLCEQQLKKIISKETVKRMKLSQSAQLVFCEVCVEGKLKVSTLMFVDP